MANEPDIEVKGLPELEGALGAFPEIAEGETSAALMKALLLLQGAAADYPPPPGGSTYRRTGTLGRLWTSGKPQVSTRGHVLEGRVGNATPYGPNVQGSDQAPVHRGRWKTIEQIISEKRPEVDALMAAAGTSIVSRVAEMARR